VTGISDLIPWDEITLPRAPWDDADCHNPSILRVPDGAHAHAGAWLCNIRATSYPADCSVAHHWPGHPRFRSHHEADLRRPGDRSFCSHTRNWLLTLDPSDWSVTSGREIAARDARDTRDTQGAGLLSCHNWVGYEDLRLAWSPKDGLVASGTALTHNDRGVFEIVVLELDADYQIWRRAPVRGWWSDECQKNWMPFLGVPSATWLHSPLGGGVVNKVGEGAPQARVFSSQLCGGTQLVPVDQLFQLFAPHFGGTARSSEAGPCDRIFAPHFGGTARSSEAGPCANNRFLGLGHGYDLVGRGGRLYWHRAIVVNAAGELLAQSQPFKLSDHDVDFACGLAVDPCSPGGDRAVVTFGVGNTESRLAETSLSALLGLCEIRA
jgi:hypothetical protein